MQARPLGLVRLSRANLISNGKEWLFARCPQFCRTQRARSRAPLFWFLRRQNRHPQREKPFLAVLRCASAHAAAFRRQSRVRTRFNGPAFLAAPRGTRRHQAGGPRRSEKGSRSWLSNLLLSPPPPKLLTPPARPSRSRGQGSFVPTPLSRRKSPLLSVSRCPISKAFRRLMKPHSAKPGSLSMTP